MNIIQTLDYFYGTTEIEHFVKRIKDLKFYIA